MIYDHDEGVIASVRVTRGHALRFLHYQARVRCAGVVRYLSAATLHDLERKVRRAFPRDADALVLALRAAAC